MHVRLGDRIRRRNLRRRQLDATPLRVAANLHNRVQQEMDVALALIDFRGHGVDQKRHVVVDDLDDCVLERPAVFLDGRIEEADLRRTRLALLPEFPERKRTANERVEGRVDDVVRSDEGEVAPDEMRGALGVIRTDPIPGLGREALDEVDFPVFRGDGHLRREILSRARGPSPWGEGVYSRRHS